MNLFQVLSMNERILVWASQEDALIITWNQSLTLQAWVCCTEEKPEAWEKIRNETWQEISVRTLSIKPVGVFGAREAAKQWMLDGLIDEK